MPRADRTTARPRPALAATILTAVALTVAGCTADPGPEPAPPPAAPQVATDTTAVTHAGNPRVPEGASWTQHYIRVDEQTELHADVLLPEGLAEGEQVPLIMSVGPYFGHAGELVPEGHAHTGPSARFDDLIIDGGLLERGYGLVLVDARGFGGSTGCPDLFGPGEQADVTAAVDWAAEQPFSTGAVGLYGKSYDASTALAGMVGDSEALRAVVAMAPLWSGEANFFSDGVPRTTIGNVATTYLSTAAIPGMPDDDERYRANAAAVDPACLIGYEAGYRSTEPDFWAARDLPALVAGDDTPLMIMQGMAEWNAEPEGMGEFLANHTGPQRGWLGPWDHVRGNDVTADGSLAAGRDGWFDEVMAFYDEHLRDGEPSEAPAFAIQDNTGTWRSADRWPTAGREVTVDLPAGRYLDDGGIRRAGERPNSMISFSETLDADLRLSGTPELTVDTRGRGNLMVALFDVAPDGTAVKINEQVAVISTAAQTVELKGHDWRLAAGHRLAVEIGTVQPGGDWIDTPSRTDVTVAGARLLLQTADPSDEQGTDGGRATYLDSYLALSTTQLTPGAPGFTL